MRRFAQFTSVMVLFALAIGCPKPTPTPPSTPVIEKLDTAGLRNCFRIHDRLISGSEPEGNAGFESLKNLGIRTLISVDGAEPDITKAHGVGLKYIHLPVGYDGISEQRRGELLKAFTQADGPVYVHCHHGKHRGPAACTVLMLGTNPAWTTDIAQDWLRQAGTDERYRGLFGLPRSYRQPTDSELSALSSTFPEVATVPDLTHRMVSVDHHWVAIKLAKEAMWTKPETSADEVLLLLQDYREAQRIKGTSERLKTLFHEAEVTVAVLETALRTKNLKEAEKQYQAAFGQCTTCHKQNRDNSSAR